jgi:N-acetylmuramoyl-L-alanine amidase
MKKPSMISILLFLTGLLCIIALIFFNRTTLHQILTTEKEVDELYEKLKMYSDVNEEIKQKHINDFKK